MGSPFGKAAYSEKDADLRNISKGLQDQTSKTYSPGSSGYSINNEYGVNPATGRSFTTLQKLGDYVPGGYQNAFTQMANSQMDALKRGLAGGTRSAVSQFGRSGLGGGGLAKMAAQNAANMSRGGAEIQRQNLMDKLGYGTDMYKFERGQGLQDELGLRSARATDAAGRRADITSQFGMDQQKDLDAYNKFLQTYGAMSANKSQGKKGWVAPLLKGGTTAAMAAMTGGASAAVPAASQLVSAGGSSGFNPGFSMFDLYK